MSESRRHRRGGRRRPAAETPGGTPERINRFLARCGLCSRREADRWILTGRVRINGAVVTTPGIRVGAGDRVEVDGRPVTPEPRHSYLAYHKPPGLLCARSDPRGRPLIYDRIEVAPNVQSVGRLDMESEGLLLLTSDGALARRLTSPASAIEREYRVRIAGHLSLVEIARLQQGGIEIGKGEVSLPWRLTVDAETGGHSWLTATLTRGRWREIRRTLAALGHPVRRLIRIRFGPIRLDDLPRGAIRPLNRGERRLLLRL
ncbi:MAG: rRNA pseudouridine synthase [Zetaproteobacteria bacterium]|nr:MAG: rRNA pseudouridine synthase [Zetaproteobacteria bacterium]